MPRRGPGPKPGPKPGRAPAGARRSRRRRRRWRRRIVVGGAVLITGAHRSRKLKQQDVQQIEEYTGAPIDELEEDELDEAMNNLGIQEEPMDSSDQAELNAAG